MNTATQKAPYELVDFASIAPVACPCGQARRGLAEVDDYPGTIHVTEISVDAKLHYHQRLTETYYFLECEPDARMQLNDEILDVRPGTCIMIRPGTRHRALGRAKVLIVVFPKFDPHDEWFDEQGPGARD
ncbi:cupin domain-containing protein [Anatilimnocola sp. NA78]|uniref:cupin domain-containing protein n=1 Tax=Anatilimnocola sp. NA78 TaxID=3415683 RepID=UPI003CE5C470